MPKTEKRIGDTYVGQGWIELHGSFTFHELRLIAQKVEMSFNKANSGKKG